MKFNHKIQLCHLDWQGMFVNQSFRKLEQFSSSQDNLKTKQVIFQRADLHSGLVKITNTSRNITNI